MLPIGKHLQGETVRLHDLVGEKAPIIREKTFEDCDLLGPAMIWVSGTGAFISCGFDGDPDSLFVEIPEQRPLMSVIQMHDCVFRTCRFNRVGIIGLPEDIANWRKGFVQGSDTNS